MSNQAAIQYAFPVTENDKRRLAVFDKDDLNNIVDRVDLGLHYEVFENLMCCYNFITPHTVSFSDPAQMTIVSPVVVDVKLLQCFIIEALEQVCRSDHKAGGALRSILFDVPHVMLRPDR
jgi:hypothetical protein